MPVNGRVTEKELRQSIVRAAQTFGWRCYFSWTSLHSPRGFPDLVLLKPPRIVFAELKTEIGKVTPAQQEWLDDLAKLPGAEVFVWRPAQLDDAYRVLMS